MKPVAIVVPWYGEDITGGAESEANYLAHLLNNAGTEVHVLTTCVKTASAPRGINTLKPGITKKDNIIVRRFQVKKQNKSLYDKSNGRIYSNHGFTIQDEEIYYSEDINSPDMYDYISSNKEQFQAFLFLPYMYGITYNGSEKCPHNCILIPCLHDEPYAHMHLTKIMMERMRGIIYLSRPEKNLADRLYDLEGHANEVLGAGIDDGWENEVNPDDFRNKYHIHNPFILYAGRKDPGKKTDLLVEYFIRYKNQNQASPLQLVMIGGGMIQIPDKHQKDILDLGFVSTKDKHNAFAAATLFCNPSWYESFSIVIMESWLAKCPVLVSSQCPVTREFCIEANGGLYFSDKYEFEAAVRFFEKNTEIREKMGDNGYRYVQKHFTKKVLAQKYLSFINEVTGYCN